VRFEAPETPTMARKSGIYFNRFVAMRVGWIGSALNTLLWSTNNKAPVGSARIAILIQTSVDENKAGALAPNGEG
jgi:carbamate kinase